MRTRINNITFTPGTRSITTGITDLAIDDIRLFINESQMKVICSSMQKDNIDSIVSGVVTYKDTFPVLVSGDHITFEIDKGDNVAKEANATTNKLAILDALAAAKLAIQGNDATATLLALKTAIANLPTVALIQNGLAKTTDIPTVQQILNGLAKTSELPTGYALDDTVAKEATLGASPDTSVSTTIFGWLKSIRDFLVGIVTTNPYAKETTAQQAASDAAAAKTAAQNAETTTQGTANKNEILAAIAANAGIPTLTIPDSTAAQELVPNTLYIFATRTSTLTLTLGTPIVGIANEYHFFVVCGSTAPTINFPAGITWNGGSAPTIAADKTYEVSILNNVAAYFEV